MFSLRRGEDVSLIVIAKEVWGGKRWIKKRGEGLRGARVEEEGLPVRTDVPRPRLTDTSGFFF